MVAKDNMAFASVEKDGFKYLMTTIAPLYKMPGRKTIITQMEEKYNVLSALKRKELSTIDHLTLTSDIWTDTLNIRSYLGVTAHYAVHEHLTSVTIGVTELTERHTANNISKWMSDICAEWRI